MKSIFNISLENDDVQSDLGGDADVSSNSVVDTIIESNVVSEVRQEESSIEQASEAIDNSIEVLGDLREQHSSTQDLLENKPEEVTDEVVAVAQEQFYITLNKLDNLTYYKGSISNELSANTPLEKLRLTHEGIGDMLSSVVNGIINAIKKIIDWIGNIIKNIINLFTGNEKKAERIQEDAKRLEQIQRINSKTSKVFEDCLNNLFSTSSANMDRTRKEIEAASKKTAASISIYDKAVNTLRDGLKELKESDDPLETLRKSQRNIENMERIFRNNLDFFLGYVAADGKISTMLDYDHKMYSHFLWIMGLITDDKKDYELNKKRVQDYIINTMSKEYYGFKIAKLAYRKNCIPILSASYIYISVDETYNHVSYFDNVKEDIMKTAGGYFLSDFRNDIVNAVKREGVHAFINISSAVKMYENKFETGIKYIKKRLEEAKHYISNAETRDWNNTNTNIAFLKKFTVDISRHLILNSSQLVRTYLNFADIIIKEFDNIIKLKK